MGNLITGRENVDGPDRWVKMNNGLTSVVVSVLAIASTAEADTESQCRLASAITTRDQSLFGRGTVGFSVCELPWNTTSFGEDRDFLIRACDRASSEVDWHLLGYQPNAKWVNSSVEGIKALLGSMEVSDVVEPESWLWSLIPATVEAMCDEHQTFLHLDGCVICNDR